MIVNQEILSFKDIPIIAASSHKSILLLRHSYRESLQNGSLDPGLTPEGWEYAVSCGKLLKDMKEVCFGASHRKRTIETVRAIIEGSKQGDEKSPIEDYPLLYDTALFSPPEGLGLAIENHTIPQLLKCYFTSGNAPTMKGRKEFAESLTDFLTGTSFAKKNVILASHDIILMALLTHYKVYPFHEEDWCGYVQGVFLHQDPAGNWTISYAVPDKENRKKHKLFV